MDIYLKSMNGMARREIIEKFGHELAMMEEAVSIAV
jgi:hypothetical protein